MLSKSLHSWESRLLKRRTPTGSLFVDNLLEQGSPLSDQCADEYKNLIQPLGCKVPLKSNKY